MIFAFLDNEAAVGGMELRGEESEERGIDERFVEVELEAKGGSESELRFFGRVFVIGEGDFGIEVQRFGEIEIGIQGG